MKIVAIVQARMGSTRLPAKVLADIAGVPLILRVLQRTTASPSVTKCIVATTVDAEDDVLVEFLSGHSIATFRGSREDVLDRYYRCALQQSADIIVRVTADDPLKDPSVIEQAINVLINDPQLDYCSNTLQPSFPEGLDIEVFRMAALDRAWREAVLPSEREHVTPYIWKNRELFHLANFTLERNLSDWRWTVDKQQDLEFMQVVFSHFADMPLVPFREVVAWLDQNPEIRKINANTVRNEGYLKSLEKE